MGKSKKTERKDAANSGPSAPVIAFASVVAGLAASAIFNSGRARQATLDYPPTGKFIEIDGVRLHYVERGAGRPLLLLHGNGACIGDMEASTLLDRAAEHYRVIVFDRPGYGHSSRPRDRHWIPEEQAAVLLTALRSMGVVNPIVFGHSWGTLVALSMALAHPGDIAALVLASGYYFPGPRIDATIASAPAIPILGDALRYTATPLIARLMTPAIARHIFAPAPVTASFGNFPIELSLRPNQIRASAAEAGAMVAAAERLSKRYDELDLPLIIVTGDGDKLVSFEDQSRRLHITVPGSEFRVIGGAGHMVHYIDPGAVLEAIDAAAEQSQAITPMSGLAGDIPR